jgi:hypothetical protein
VCADGSVASSTACRSYSSARTLARSTRGNGDAVPIKESTFVARKRRLSLGELVLGGGIHPIARWCCDLRGSRANLGDSSWGFGGVVGARCSWLWE